MIILDDRAWRAKLDSAFRKIETLARIAVAAAAFCDEAERVGYESDEARAAYKRLSVTIEEWVP